MSRGYFAVGILNPRTPENVGSLWRSAFLYDAAFIFTVGTRYKGQASDTPKTPRHVPMFHFPTVDDLVEHLPHSCPLVGIELDDRAVPLANFTHPERACYLLGSETSGIPQRQLARCHHVVQIETPQPWSMNVACAGATVLHDRYVSRKAAS